MSISGGNQIGYSLPGCPLQGRSKCSIAPGYGAHWLVIVCAKLLTRKVSHRFINRQSSVTNGKGQMGNAAAQPWTSREYIGGMYLYYSRGGGAGVAKAGCNQFLATFRYSEVVRTSSKNY